MSNVENITARFSQPVPWLQSSGDDDDIAIASRIRVARNFKTVPFPVAANVEQRLSVVEMVRNAISGIAAFDHCYDIDMLALDELSKMILLERRLISKEFIATPDGCGLFVAPQESVSVMVNEEDHIRLQALRPGFCLRECWEAVTPLERELDRRLPLAYDLKYGYLTSCPTNVGTGMRVSVMLHLPGLVMTDQIPTVERSAAKLGLAIRGFMGEGSEHTGSLFQISNQSTLGESEQQIIERLETVIRQIIIYEKQVRERLKNQRGPYLMNQVGRAYGMLKYAYILNAKEAVNALSSLRLGYDLGMFYSVSVHLLNSLLMKVQPAHLLYAVQKQIPPEERDIFRAAMVRDALRVAETK